MNNKILGKWDFIFLLGESGGGKGTLVNNIKNFWLKDLKCSSMGDIFREKAKTDEKIKSLTEQGILIDDSVTLEIFKEFALENAPGLIDGFPRNRQQALQAIKFVKEYGWRILVIDLKCDVEVILERLLARGRADDKLDIMYKRNLDHRTLHPTVMREIENRSDLFDIITINGNNYPGVVCNDFLLGILRQVDMLYLYEFKNSIIDFTVKPEETTINDAMSRWISQMLINIQKELDKNNRVKPEVNQ